MSDSSLTLNDNHRNALHSGFKYIDKLVSEGFEGVIANGESGAVFDPLVADATPVQQKVIADQLARLRRAIRTALGAFNIPVRPPTISALWGLRTNLNFIEVAVEELGPKHLRGYGVIDAATEIGVNAQLAQIRTIIAELSRYLADGLGGDLAARVTRLDQTKNEIQLLRELERIVAAHGLVEFRLPLTQLLERLEKPRWTVAFVGRVSCGKSSLLNFLLGTNILPSGVTPVTAVPIRIIRGPDPQATICFATGRPERIPADQLGKFASEEENPGNASYVTDIELELPVERLAGDICFVDTPGLGSLATTGAAQTLAFLPRCDVGVLMIDAAATPTEEDIGVARSLLEGGAEVLVVVSKADLLTAPDRTKMEHYIASRFAAALGQALTVAPISIAAAHADLAEHWWQGMIAPRLSRNRELAAVALRRKIGGLREAVINALVRASQPGGTRASAAPAQLGLARAAIENARRKAYDIPFKATPPSAQVLAAAAAALVTEEGDADLAAGLAQELGRAAADFARHFEAAVNDTRLLAQQALTAALSNESAPSAELSAPSSRPLFDPAPVLAAGGISLAWKRWPALAARRAALGRALRSRYSVPLDAALRNYGHALVGWTQHYLDDLAAQFNAQAGLVEAAIASVHRGEAGPTAPGIVPDLELLRAWNTQPAA
jgi:GTP-binding protein EngB required for normal cell division